MGGRRGFDDPRIAVLLRRRLAERRLTPKPVAEAAGVAERTIYRALAGDPIDLNTLAKIVEALQEIEPHAPTAEFLAALDDVRAAS